MIINRRICDLGIPERILLLLPPRLAYAIKQIAEGCGEGICEEIRIRRGRCSSLTVSGGKNLPIALEHPILRHEMEDIVARISGGSLYAHSETIKQGYISLGDGIRAGISGRAAYDSNKMIGVDDISGICIRLPHYVNINVTVLRDLLLEMGSCGGMLIYSPPGEGKTTVLRSLASSLAETGARKVVVVDSRGELEYGLSRENLYLDILSGYTKSEGIEIALRTMGANIIVCDEIGGREDVGAICEASVGGAALLASAHGRDIDSLMHKPNIRTLIDSGAFDYLVGIYRRGFEVEYSITSVREL